MMNVEVMEVEMGAAAAARLMPYGLEPEGGEAASAAPQVALPHVTAPVNCNRLARKERRKRLKRSRHVATQHTGHCWVAVADSGEFWWELRPSEAPPVVVLACAAASAPAPPPTEVRQGGRGADEAKAAVGAQPTKPTNHWDRLPVELQAYILLLRSRAQFRGQFVRNLLRHYRMMRWGLMSPKLKPWDRDYARCGTDHPYRSALSDYPTGVKLTWSWEGGNLFAKGSSPDGPVLVGRGEYNHEYNIENYLKLATAKGAEIDLRTRSYGETHCCECGEMCFAQVRTLRRPEFASYGEHVHGTGPDAWYVFGGMTPEECVEQLVEEEFGEMADEFAAELQCEECFLDALEYGDWAQDVEDERLRPWNGGRRMRTDKTGRRRRGYVLQEY